jgi:hypothetical protein
MPFLGGRQPFHPNAFAQVDQLQPSAKSASAAARELERRGYATARGGKWSAARHQDPPAAGGLTLVVRIAISAEAFAAISTTLPLGSVSYENKTNDRGERKPPAPTPCSGSLCSPPFSYGRRFT